MSLNLLLLSSSRVAETAFLQHAVDLIQSHLASCFTDNKDHQNKKLVFIPYAGVTISYDEYFEIARRPFAELGYNLSSIHQYTSPQDAILQADVIIIGGGNTFELVNQLYKHELIPLITEQLKSGKPYIGWSAGSNIAAPTIRTTNDMPIVEPASFNALNLLPFQINPHYLEVTIDGHQGETREQRIREFLEINPGQRVVGIPEGTALQLSGSQLKYVGSQAGVIFSSVTGEATKTFITSTTNINFLLDTI
ncbi:dipeptidase PepE [Aliikangiella maris]|uniref:Dipeptidase PepE n=2 Tax=Aliikangiella maris TaxID=3162458 RepID=A0ABV3MIR1_9GAMM